MLAIRRALLMFFGTCALLYAVGCGDTKMATLSASRLERTVSASGLKGDKDDDESARAATGHVRYDDDADSDNDTSATEPTTYYDADDVSVRDFGESAVTGRRTTYSDRG